MLEIGRTRMCVLVGKHIRMIAGVEYVEGL
jgi:hypothetical protein